MNYHFLQGKKDLYGEVDAKKSLELIQEKIGSFFDMKNLCFLFGSGTSANAIPLMSGLYDGLQQEKSSYTEKEREFLDAIEDNGNIENVMGILYSGREYLIEIKNLTEAEMKRLKVINSLINKIEAFIKLKLDVLNADDWNDETHKTLENYKKFYSKVALRNKELSRYRKRLYGEARRKQPIHLIMDEAHRYIRKSRGCILRENIFEKIAREGRKYSLYLIISSQRPSELSETVLSQCGNYIVHRIQNEMDLKYIYSVLPYFSEDFVTKIKQSVPGEALVFGTCVPMPLLVKVPRAVPDLDSDDCKISEEWFEGGIN